MKAHRTLKVGPLVLEVEAHPSLTDVLDALCAGFDQPTPLPTRHVLRLSLTRTDEPRGDAPRYPEFRRVGDLVVDRSACWNASLRVAPEASEASFELRDLSYVTPEVARPWEDSWVAGAVRVALAMVAPQLGGLLVHGAALVAPGLSGASDGRGVVFLGPSGAGKTTITRRLPGWRVLADDAVLVHPMAGGFAVTGTPVPGRERLPRRGESVPLAALVHLDKDADAVALTPLPAAPAFAALLARILYFAPPDDAVVAAAHAIISHCDSARLASSLHHDIGSHLGGW